MELVDSRRLTGPNVLQAEPGAVIEVEVEAGMRADFVAAWEAQVRRVLEAVGWGSERTSRRLFDGGASLAISAPVDALYAATEVNEHAFELARRVIGGEVDPELETAALARTIGRERNAPLLALQAAARERGVAFLSDDDEASVGLGAGSRTWRVDALPAPDDVDWGAVHDVPVALVTGTNGKTTTVRLLARIVEVAGRTPGVSSTDWIRVGDELVERGDWSGPGGARRVLRAPEVDVAILETARGGMLRRGLGVTEADVALITNVAEDHLGEWGIRDLAALVETKFVVARAGRTLVLNADDPEVVARAASVDRPIVWFTLDAADARVRAHVGAGGAAAVLEDGALWFVGPGAERERILAVDEVPIALGGAARHNVANALAAAAVARELGLSTAVIRDGLAGFHSSPRDNPGRLNDFDLGGARVLVDFAHNPHGFEALFEMASALPAERRLVLIGQAGDRDDESVRELCRIAWRARPDRIVVKEMPKVARGRSAAEVARVIEEELRSLGATDAHLDHAESEIGAVRRALEWARPGDLLLCLSHSERDSVLALCERLDAEGWAPGETVPV